MEITHCLHIPTCIMISLQSITNPPVCPSTDPSESVQIPFFNGGHRACKKFGLAKMLVGFSVDSQHWVSQHQVIYKKAQIFAVLACSSSRANKNGQLE